jgi:hypothetical protein
MSNNLQHVHGDVNPVFAIDTLNGSGSATTGTPVMLQGPYLEFFNIDCGADVSTQMGVDEAVDKVLKCVTQLATLHFYQVEASTGQVSIAFYPIAAWTAGTLQTAIQALDTGAGYRFNAATVTDNGFKLA